MSPRPKHVKGGPVSMTKEEKQRVETLKRQGFRCAACQCVPTPDHLPFTLKGGEVLCRECLRA